MAGWASAAHFWNPKQKHPSFPRCSPSLCPWSAVFSAFHRRRSAPRSPAGHLAASDRQLSWLGQQKARAELRQGRFDACASLSAPQPALPFLERSPNCRVHPDLGVPWAEGQPGHPTGLCGQVRAQLRTWS